MRNGAAWLPSLSPCLAPNGLCTEPRGSRKRVDASCENDAVATLVSLLRIAMGLVFAYAIGAATLLTSMQGLSWFGDGAGFIECVRLCLTLTAPIVVSTVVVGEWTADRRPWFYLVTGAIATLAPIFLFVWVAPLSALRVVGAGALGGLAYWVSAGRRAGFGDARRRRAIS